MVCRILVFMWPLGPLISLGPRHAAVARAYLRHRVRSSAARVFAGALLYGSWDLYILYCHNSSGLGLGI